MNVRFLALAIAALALVACRGELSVADTTETEAGSTGEPTSTGTSTTTSGTTASSASGGGTATAGASGSSTGYTTSTGTSTGTTGSGNGPPMILNFSTTVAQITQGESVTFGAIVTDPDGAGDILGGQLTSRDGALTYGNLVSGGGGAFSLELTWTELHGTQAIASDGEQRRFRARFVDSAAHEDEGFVDLTFTCAGQDLCDGVCTNLETDGQNCGSCGNLCPNGGTCTSVGCDPVLTPCFYIPDTWDTCDERCAALGETCVQGGCDGHTVYSGPTNPICTDFPSEVNGVGCGDSLFGVLPGMDYRCCCSDTT